MSRINTCFSTLKQQNRKALIPFITAGDPTPALTVPLMHSLVEAGANVIELGIPFSDPMADGPTIQRASERALMKGVHLKQVLEMVSQFRQTDNTTPVVLMGYLNPIEIMGYENFAQTAQNSGVDGILTVDLPPEEAMNFIETLNRYQIAAIFLLAPTTSEARMQKIINQAQGYLYYVSLKGVTGGENLDVSAVKAKVEKLHQLTDLPIGVGFGIRDPQTAKQVAAFSEAVIVGSALIKLIETVSEEELIPQISHFIGQLRTALDA